MTDPFSEPRAPGAAPYHLRNDWDVGDEMFVRHRRLLAALERLERAWREDEWWRAAAREATA